jgi:futalosine hydrolase
MDVLIVVATAAEAQRLSGLNSPGLTASAPNSAGSVARIQVCGVGPVAAALATQAALLRGPRPDLVISAGIGGAFVHPGAVAVGAAAVASEMLYGDLGAWTGGARTGEAPNGGEKDFLSLEALGLSVFPDGPKLHAALPAPNPGRFPAWEGSAVLASRLGVACGPFVTVSGATGSGEQAQALLRRFPGALIEGMEGAGVAHAAALYGVPCTEIRGASNLVGPRDRASWQIGAALGALRSTLESALQFLD